MKQPLQWLTLGLLSTRFKIMQISRGGQGNAGLLCGLYFGDVEGKVALDRKTLLRPP